MVSKEIIMKIIGDHEDSLSDGFHFYAENSYESTEEVLGEIADKILDLVSPLEPPRSKAMKEKLCKKIEVVKGNIQKEKEIREIYANKLKNKKVVVPEYEEYDYKTCFPDVPLCGNTEKGGWDEVSALRNQLRCMEYELRDYKNSSDELRRQFAEWRRNKKRILHQKKRLELRRFIPRAVRENVWDMCDTISYIKQLSV